MSPRQKLTPEEIKLYRRMAKDAKRMLELQQEKRAARKRSLDTEELGVRP